MMKDRTIQVSFSQVIKIQNILLENVSIQSRHLLDIGITPYLQFINGVGEFGGFRNAVQAKLVQDGYTNLLIEYRKRQ